MARTDFDTPRGRAHDVDPITFSVMLNRLNSIATEMTIALENAAMTSILALARDYSCCVYDSHLRQVAMVDAVPIHTNSMHLLLGRVVEQFGDDIHEGDVIACNYAYAGNTHIGDLVTICPVFHEGEHLFWAAAKGHQLDVGAPVPSTAYAWAGDVWQEGLKIPPVKLYERGAPRRDVIDLYLANMRWREPLEGDLMAMFGSIWTAERRLKELCVEHGAADVRRYVDALIAYGAQRTRAEIGAMPNGTYRAEGWLDTDGVGTYDIPVRAAVTIADTSVDVDFAGSAPQVATAVNATEAVMTSAAGIPLVMSIDPQIPHNEGCLRCVTVSAPEGSICNAAYPASTAAATTTPGDLMQDVVAKALAQAVPERARGGSAHWSNIPMLSGVDPRSGVFWGHMFLNGGGGGGAAHGTDGWPLFTTAAAQGGLKAPSVEHTELLYPILFHAWELATDSMGMGAQIGGPGVRCTIEPLHAPLQMLGRSDGQRNPPYGVLGATPGSGGGHYVERADGRRTFLGQAYHLTLRPGERWTGVSTGGGGYGNPLARPLERVLADVRDGLCSPAMARAVYGLVLTDAGDAVDEQASAEARAAIADEQRRNGVPVVLPERPAAATWLQETIRERDEVAPEYAGPWAGAR